MLDIISWVETYVNLFLWIGLGSVSLFLFALIMSQLVKFVNNEYKKYKPSIILEFILKILASNSVTNFLIGKFISDHQPNCNITSERQNSGDTLITLINCRLDIIEKAIQDILSKIKHDNDSETIQSEKEIISTIKKPEVTKTEKFNLLNSLVRSSVDLSKLDESTKLTMTASLISTIREMRYIANEMKKNEDEFKQIIERIVHNAKSLLCSEAKTNPELNKWLENNPNFPHGIDWTFGLGVHCESVLDFLY